MIIPTPMISMILKKVETCIDKWCVNGLKMWSSNEYY